MNNQNEYITAMDKEITGSRLHICNRLLTNARLFNKTSHNYAKEVIYSFHSDFYDLSFDNNYFSMALNQLGIRKHNPATNIEEFIQPEDYAFDSAANISKAISNEQLIIELDALQFAITMWLTYDKRSKPTNRYAPMGSFLEEYSPDYVTQQEILKKMCSADKEDFFKYYVCNAFAYFSSRTFNKVQRQLIVKKGVATRLYLSNSLLSLAWCEIEYCIENNIYFKKCVVCGNWFPIEKHKAKRETNEGRVKCAYTTPCKKTCGIECQKEYKKLADRIKKQIKREPIEKNKDKLKKLFALLSNGNKDIGEIISEYEMLIKKRS